MLYTGTFEAYQGLDLLFAAMALVRRRGPTRGWCWPAASPIRSSGARRRRGRAGIDDVTIFAGERPAEEIPAYLLAADVLVSPRSRGTNTPLKIYQYLRSGKPIVATRLLTHTQVLDDDTAFLTGRHARGVCRGHPRGARRSGARRGDRQRAPGSSPRPKYSYEAYLERTRQACARAGVSRRSRRRRVTP